MLLFLGVFSLFNLAAAAAGAGAFMRLATPEIAAEWASRRLLLIARLLTGGLAVIALAASWTAWSLSSDHPLLALLVLAPIAWLTVMGIVFAVVDFAEDGVLDFGRGPRVKR